MKNRSLLGFGLAALIVSMGVSQAFAADGAPVPDMRAMFEKVGADGQRAQLTDEQKSAKKLEMEAKRAENEEKLNAFIQTLSDEQAALFEAMTPARAKASEPAWGQSAERPERPERQERPEMPDTAAMEAMKESREAFIASLTEAQKEVFEELFGFAPHTHPMTDERKTAMKSEMEAGRAQRQEKLDAFIQTLSDEQKALYEAARPTPAETSEPFDGEPPQRPDEASMKEMKEKWDAFKASLTEEQKEAYESMFGKPGFGRPGAPGAFGTIGE